MTLDPRWRDVRNVLAVRLDNLGDVLMSTPALAAVRAGLPEARLTLLGSSAARVLAPHLPLVDEVIVHDAPWVKGPAGTSVGERRFIDALAERRFDAAVIFTVCTQSALPAAMMCHLAGIPLRLAHSRENPYALLTDWVHETDVVEDGMRHEVARQLALVRTVGFEAASDHLRLQVAEADIASVRRQLAEAGVSPHRPLVVVHPGATAASRRWPPDRFGLAADRLAERAAAQVVFAGSRDEAPLVDAARTAMTAPAVSLAGRLSFGELAALVALADVLLCNNSGPAHVAAAVGTPVVVLYALTNPQHTPWQVDADVLSHDVPCRNCLRSVCPEAHHACLMAVTPDQVAGAALRHLTAPGAVAA